MPPFQCDRVSDSRRIPVERCLHKRYIGSGLYGLCSRESEYWGGNVSAVSLSPETMLDVYLYYQWQPSVSIYYTITAVSVSCDVT